MSRYVCWAARSASCVAFCIVAGVIGCSQHGAGAKADGAHSSENCTDGIDNDGNGLVDCADPACQAGFICVAAPDGWTIGAFLPTIPASGEACPDGYSSKPFALEEPASSVTCSCTCATSCGEIACGSPNDDSPPGLLAVSTGTTDAGCSDGDAGTLASTGCVAYHLTAGRSIGFADPPFWSGGIASVGHDIIDHPNVLLCTASATGSGCGARQACVPKPSGGWSISPYQPGKVDAHALAATVTCPPDWVSAVEGDGGVPVAVAVATSWNDFAACTPCECQLDPEAACADATLTLYTDSNCQSAASSVGPGACATVDADIQSARYSAFPVHAGCTASPSQPTGVETSAPDGGFIVCSAR